MSDIYGSEGLVMEAALCDLHSAVIGSSQITFSLAQVIRQANIFRLTTVLDFPCTYQVCSTGALRAVCSGHVSQKLVDAVERPLTRPDFRSVFVNRISGGVFQ